MLLLTCASLPLLLFNPLQDDHLGIIPTETLEELQQKVLKTVKESGVRTIFLNKIQSDGLNMTAHILDDLDMLTDDYLYIFTPQAVPTDSVGTIFGPLGIDSPLDRLLKGGLILDHHDLYRADGDQDPFLKMWKSQDSAAVIQRLVEAYPEWANEFDANDLADYFETNMPADYSAFLYDAIISIGNGACYATTEKIALNDTKPFRNDIQAYNFTGATGPVFWGRPEHSCRYKSNRCNNPVKFGIFNIQAVPIGNNMNTYKTSIVAEWDEVNRWQKKNELIFRSGQTTAPTNLREAKEKNYLSTSTRRFGYFLFGSAAYVSAMSLVSLILLRKQPTVVRSQPFFLGFVAVGSFLMSVAILTLTFDEVIVTTQLGLDVACMSTQWFFFIGHVLTFAALFTKLRRLNVVLQFKRGVKMSIVKAMLPLIATMGLTVTILVVWTIVDPWQWERDWITLVPAETYGQCTSEHFWAFFGPLITIVGVAEGVSIFFAWKTADVNQDYGETQPCIRAMYSQFQAWLVGIPILVVLNDSSSADAVFLGRALLIWIFSMSGVVFVIGPKLHKTIYEIRHPQEVQANRRRSSFKITGLNHPDANNTAQSSSLRGSRLFAAGLSSEELSASGNIGNGSSHNSPSQTSISGGIDPKAMAAAVAGIKWPDSCKDDSEMESKTQSQTDHTTSNISIPPGLSEMKIESDVSLPPAASQSTTDA